MVFTRYIFQRFLMVREAGFVAPDQPVVISFDCKTVQLATVFELYLYVHGKPVDQPSTGMVSAKPSPRVVYIWGPGGWDLVENVGDHMQKTQKHLTLVTINADSHVVLAVGTGAPVPLPRGRAHIGTAVQL